MHETVEAMQLEEVETEPSEEEPGLQANQHEIIDFLSGALKTSEFHVACPSDVEFRKLIKTACSCRFTACVR